MPWKLALGEVNGEPVVIILERGAATWTTLSASRFDVIGQGIERIVDYVHCSWVIQAATSVEVSPLG